MLGISSGEFVVLLLVAAFVIGPERLPGYAQQLARLVRELRRMAQGASEQVRAEMGPAFDDVDWRKLDPRQYDPRRIVREALADSWDPDDPLGLRDIPVHDGAGQRPGSAGAGRAGAGSTPGGSRGTGAGRGAGDDPEQPAPFDPDAT